MYKGCTIIYVLSIVSYRSQEICLFLPLLLRSLMVGVNNWVDYYLNVVFVCLHTTLSLYHNYADSSERIEMLFKYILWSLKMVVRIIVLHIIVTIKSEIWIRSQSLGLGHGTMVCTLRLVVFSSCHAYIYNFRWFTHCLIVLTLSVHSKMKCYIKL